MKLTKRLAYSQLVTNKRRTIWTLLGIVLATAMITAVYGFAASGAVAITDLMGDAYIRDVYYRTIYIVGVVLSFVIVAVSVIVVSNAFRVSAGERLTQFGLLKSVGATKRQITEVVVWEGVLLSVIGIPVGILLGLLVQVIGVGIANHMLQGLNNNNVLDDAELVFNFVLAWQAVLASIVISFVTVFLSAWLPARKAAKIAAVDAIRGVDEIKISAKKMRTSFITRKIFGFEGELAAKSLKRSRRNFRATVVSLSISMTLFIAASSFGTTLSQYTNLVFALMDADVFASFHSSRVQGEFVSITHEEAEAITARIRAQGATVFGVGGDVNSFSVSRETLQFTSHYDAYLRQHEDWDPYASDGWPITLLVVDAENHAELARRAGVSAESNILINHVRTRDININWIELDPLVFTGQTLQLQSRDDSGGVSYLPLHGELRGRDVPNELIHAAMSDIVVLVPDVNVHYYFWAAQTDRPHELTEYVRGFLWETLPTGNDGIINASVFNQAAEEDAIRSLFNTIMTSMYGFIGMLTLIALTNVISTISTNVRTRSREFAILQSVGMTHGGLKNMLNLESIMCSAKSLVFGLPFGLGISYLIYLGMQHSATFRFSFPWLAILQCVVAVFVITWLTMRFAVSRLQGQGGGVVERIRGEVGR